MRVIWTHEAERSFNQIIDHLMFKWTQKEALAFIDLVEDSIERVTKNPEMFRLSTHHKEIREAVITKHTTMFYRVSENFLEIDIIPVSV